MMRANPGTQDATEESRTVSLNRCGGRLREGYWCWINRFSGEVMIETKYGKLEIRRTNGKELSNLEKAETQACRGERLSVTWWCLSELQRPQASLKVEIQLGFKIGRLLESL